METIDNVLLNISLKLIDNQDLLKLLWFNEKNALSQNNITDTIKYSMIDQEDLTNTKIFITPFTGAVIEAEKSELRAYLYNVTPDNNILSRTVFNFEVLVHNNLWILDQAKQRPVRICSEVLKSLNGQEVNGIGRLYFSNRDRIQLVRFNENYTGYIFSMQNWCD